MSARVTVGEGEKKERLASEERKTRRIEMKEFKRTRSSSLLLLSEVLPNLKSLSSLLFVDTSGVLVERRRGRRRRRESVQCSRAREGSL